MDNPRAEEIMGTGEQSANQGKITHLSNLYKFGMLGSPLFISRLIKELLSNQKTILDNEQYSEQINTIRVNIISKLIESIPDMKRRLIKNQN